MSAFYIGQRVKKVRGRNSIGVTGVVVEIGAGLFGGDMKVRVDQPTVAKNVIYGYECVLPAGSERWTDSHLWEPIVPPGLESIEEINALYEPQEATA